MYEMPLLALFEARAHRLLAEHHVDAEVLADVAQEVEIAEAREPVGVVDELRAACAEIEEARELCAQRRRRCAADLRVESSLRSSLLPLGSPIIPVAPPTSAIGWWPARCARISVRMRQQAARRAGCRRWDRSPNRA